jgi:hypothetical protein
MVQSLGGSQIGYEECKDDAEWDTTRSHIITSKLVTETLHEAGSAGYARQYFIHSLVRRPWPLPAGNGPV